MYHHRIYTRIIAGILSLCLVVPTITIFAVAADEDYSPSSSDLWNSLSDFKTYPDLYDYLSDHDWVNGSLEYSDFEYILLLTDQLCSMYHNVNTSLILAQIAVESRFDIFTTNKTARGLMQLIPVYHEGRMGHFVEEDHILTLDDFYNPRLNVVTGIDYMSELLNTTDGDIAYSLMCYNEGPSTARKHYKENGHTSYYAQEVMRLSLEIEQYLSEGR